MVPTLPSFAVEGSAALLLARALAVAATMAAFGAMLFAALVAPKALERAAPEVRVAHERSARRLVRVLVLVGLGALLLWTALQSAEIAGTGSLASVLTVVSATVFGHVVLGQIAALGASGLVFGRSRARRWAATGLSGAALALQAGHDHALAMNGVGLLLLSDVIHLLAAGAWLGGLIPLLVLVRQAPPRAGAMAARWFSPPGKVCVVALASSAAFQWWELIGGVPGFIGTEYGWTAAVKLGLFLVLFGFALANRYRLAPALMRPDRPEAAKRALVGSIAVQTGFGLLAVLAAAVLTSLPPAIHEQPVWPFPLRPSTVALAEPEIRQEVAFALLALAGAVGLLLVGVGWRRLRYPALGSAAVVCFLAYPHLTPLLVEAYPTSYFHSPTGFAADGDRARRAALSRALRLLPRRGRARGRRRRRRPARAAGRPDRGASLGARGRRDVLVADAWDRGAGGRPGDAGLRSSLSADDRWDLIDYVRAHNVGVALRDTDAWPAPVHAPPFSVSCSDPAVTTTDDLRGRVLHLITKAGDGPALASPSLVAAPGVPIVSILLTPEGSASASGTSCVSTDAAAWDAYAVLAGLAPRDLGGTQFLVDPDGWLRAEQVPGRGGPRWNDPAALLAEANAICTHRIGASGGGGHVHH